MAPRRAGLPLPVLRLHRTALLAITLCAVTFTLVLEACAGGARTGARSFLIGLNSGPALTYDLRLTRSLRAAHVRAGVPIDTTVAELAPSIRAYAAAGVQPLLLATFKGRTPTERDVQNLARWARAFGPGGTFWRGRPHDRAVVVTRIEFGNEANDPSQYPETRGRPDGFADPRFLARAREYAVRVRAAAITVRAANRGVGVLAVGDQADGRTTWLQTLLSTEPDLPDQVAGWTVHPYGPPAAWHRDIDTALDALDAHGADDARLEITEWGLATDDGRCLSDNYGWNRCFTYAAAARTLRTTVAAMRAAYGARLASFYLFAGSDAAPSGRTRDREAYFGAVRSDGRPKGAFTAAIASLLTHDR